jgi:hypothetical protein
MAINRRNNPNGYGFDNPLDESGYDYLNDYAPDQAINASTIPEAIPLHIRLSREDAYQPHRETPDYSDMVGELTTPGEESIYNPLDFVGSTTESPTDQYPRRSDNTGIDATTGFPTIRGFDETLGQHKDWDPFFRWAHEGAPTGRLTRTSSYDPSQFASPTRESPLWTGGRFSGEGQTYEPYIGGGLGWSGLQPEYTGQSPRFLEGGPVDTGRARTGWTPTTAEEEAQGQRWLQQLEDAYSEYGSTPYAEYERTGTSPGLQLEQQAWNELADRYNLERQAKIDQWNEDQRKLADLGTAPPPNVRPKGVTVGLPPTTPSPPTTLRSPILPSGNNTSDPNITPRRDIDEFGLTEVDPSSMPMYPPNYQDYMTIRAFDDPLSQMQNLGIEGLTQGGGRVRTPLSAQTDIALSDLMASRGELAPTQDEALRGSELDRILAEGGISDATPLEQETQDLLRDLISRGGQLPPDDQRRAMEIETARSPLDVLRQSQLAEGRAAMAGRGLLGQGPEVEYGERLEQRLAPMYTQAAQQIQLDEANRSEERYRTAMEALSQQATFQRASADERYNQANQLRTSLALDSANRQDDRLANAINQSANLTEAQSRNLVDTINATTGVQQMRNSAAIDVLDRNIAWNQFLAEFDLKRSEVIEMIDKNRFGEILPFLNAYMQAIQVGATGWREQT